MKSDQEVAAWIGIEPRSFRQALAWMHGSVHPKGSPEYKGTDKALKRLARAGMVHHLHRAWHAGPDPYELKQRVNVDLGSEVVSISQRDLDWYKPDPSSGCWIWQGNRRRRGYGVIKNCERTAWSAHRVFYAAHVGPVPDDLFVLQKCDIPSCVNPEHLFLGTHQENMDDMVSKSRGANQNTRKSAPTQGAEREVGRG